MERSLVKSGQCTIPLESVETENRFAQVLLHAHMEQYLFSVLMGHASQFFNF